MQGQIANLVLSLNGLEQQRLFVDSLYSAAGNTEENIKYTQDFIHHLTSVVGNFISSFDPDQTDPSEPTVKDLDTYYISKYIFTAMMTLNKYVQEPKYGSQLILDSNTLLGGVKPFNNYFSRDLFNLVKDNSYYVVKPSVSNKIEVGAKGFNTCSNCVEFKTVKELLDQTKFYSLTSDEPPVLTSSHDISTSIIIPEKFSIKHSDFAANMKILMTDLYKEYYFYELIDIQNRLNTTSTGVAGSGAATNILDSVLRTLIQQARNNFTREIYNKVEEITTEFPMSAIVEELNDTVSTIDGATGSFKIFDDLDTGINLYQFIKEKTRMMNTVGNAIHYNLELLKRLQNIGEYEGGDQNKILDETMCCKGIDEGVAIISNLIKIYVY